MSLTNTENELGFQGSFMSASKVNLAPGTKAPRNVVRALQQRYIIPNSEVNVAALMESTGININRHLHNNLFHFLP